MDVAPAAEIQALHQRLLEADDAVTFKIPKSSEASTAPPLIGRQPEWQTLRGAWQTALQGQPRLVAISGEAGIGKTRLAEELFTWASQQGVGCARTRAYQAEGALTYAPITELLRTDIIRYQLSSLSDLRLTQIARLLPELLEERPNLAPPLPMTDDWQRQQFYDALTHAILGSGQPCLLLLDDLQWCDAETLAWLHHLLRSAAGSMLLLVGTIRTGETDSNHPLHTLMDSLQRNDWTIEISLSPLTTEEVAALAQSLNASDLGHNQLTALFEDTGGNPLFVVETIRAGQSKADSDSVDSDETGLPPKIHAVIRSRFSQLSPETQVLANLAAVNGRSFGYEVLLAASSVDEDELVDSLDELLHKQIIREQSADVYDFSNDTMRDVLYNGISRTRRRLLHRRLARALAEVHAGELSTVCAQLAHHHEQAGDGEGAFPYLLMAGEQAFIAYALQQAEDYYMRANVLAQTESNRAETSLRLGRVYLAQDKADVAIETFLLDWSRLPPPMPHSLSCSITWQTPTLPVLRSQHVSNMCSGRWRLPKRLMTTRPCAKAFR